MSDDEERKEFEAWYARTAFDYVLSPIGSRDCSLQWRAWQQAHARGIVAGMRRAAEIAIDISNTVHHESCNFGDDYKIGYAEGSSDVCHAARRAADKLEREQEQQR